MFHHQQQNTFAKAARERGKSMNSNSHRRDSSAKPALKKPKGFRTIVVDGRVWLWRAQMGYVVARADDERSLVLKYHRPYTWRHDDEVDPITPRFVAAWIQSESVSALPDRPTVRDFKRTMLPFLKFRTRLCPNESLLARMQSRYRNSSKPESKFRLATSGPCIQFQMIPP